MLESRIRQGDYAIRDLPTELELAEEIGVSRMTARRALLELMNKGLLVRKPHGKIAVNQEHEHVAGKLLLAFLSPAWSSPEFEGWRSAVARAAQKFGASVRMVDFVHWDDPVIYQTLTGFDGVFLVPSSEPMPQPVLERFSGAGNLVVLDTDLTGAGIPSVQLQPPIFLHHLADYLAKLGHRRIDCLNTQPHDEVVKKRIEQWLLWQKVHKVEGRLIDEPVEPFSDAMPKACAVIHRLLDAKDFHATALLCITGPAATGAIRAFVDHKMQIGRDISVCAFNEGGGLHRYLVPSRTVLEPTDPSAYLEMCIDWFSRQGSPWVGPLLVQAASVPLFIGESTGPAPEKARHHVSA